MRRSSHHARCAESGRHRPVQRVPPRRAPTMSPSASRSGQRLEPQRDTVQSSRRWCNRRSRARCLCRVNPCTPSCRRQLSNGMLQRACDLDQVCDRALLTDSDKPKRDQITLLGPIGERSPSICYSAKRLEGALARKTSICWAGIAVVGTRDGHIYIACIAVRLRLGERGERGRCGDRQDRCNRRSREDRSLPHPMTLTRLASNHQRAVPGLRQPHSEASASRIRVGKSPITEVIGAFSAPSGTRLNPGSSAYTSAPS